MVKNEVELDGESSKLAGLVLLTKEFEHVWEVIHVMIDNISAELQAREGMKDLLGWGLNY